MTLQEKAEAKFRSSGISKDHVKQAKFKVLDGDKIAALSPSFHAVGGIKIPYFNLDGSLSAFYRVRYLEPLPGFAGTIEKPQRYAQPPRTGVKAYLAPTVGWEEISADSNQPVAFTEGEFKAYSVACMGFPLIGLGGVYSFRSAREGKTLLPELEKFDWEERVVYIVFDNDIAHKVEVMRAQRALAQELLSRGAKIFIMELPHGPHKGLDDYLVASGNAEDAWQVLMDAAHPYGESEALWALNEELLYVREINAVLERSSSMLMKPDVFMRHTYANRYLIKQVEKKGKGKNAKPVMVLQKDPAAQAWMHWEKRAEVSDLCYEPGQGQDHQNKYNMWKGWGCQPKKGDMKPWHDLLDYLFQNDDKSKRWFLKWLAYPLQNPGAKLYSACLLWSRHKRLGKSIIGITMKYIYGDNAATINSKQLKADFNTWAKNKQLIIGEEITAGEARVESDYLKTLITQQTITIDEKFKPIYTIRDCMNHLYFSNHLDALFLEDGDERFFVKEFTQAPASREFYDRINAWLHKDGNQNLGEPGEGPPALFYYLLNMDLSDFNPREHAPLTAAKRNMILASKNDIGMWVQRLLDDPASCLRPLGAASSDKCDLFTPTQLYKAFDPERRLRGSESALGRALGAAGFRHINGGIPVVTSSGTHRLYAVRNQVQWEQASRKEIKMHYDEFYGPGSLGVVGGGAP